jgi:methylase of polypeptide subunit release factors
MKFKDIKINSSNGIANKTQFSQTMCDAISLNYPKRLLDIGCGSGIIGLFSLLNKTKFVCFNDIQPDAITLTKHNLQSYKIDPTSYQFIHLPFQKIDLTHYQFDAIAFNPPQLPTEMVSIDNFNASQEKIFRDGGKNGRDLIEQFLDWLILSLPIKTIAYIGISSMLLIDDLLKNYQDKGLIFSKKFQQRVLLRSIFYPFVDKMENQWHQDYELIKKGTQWYKKIYIIECIKND